MQKPQDRTIRIPLIGGLGNQLFQFAGGLAIQKSVNAEIYFFDDLIRGSKVLNITPRKVAIENITDNTAWKNSDGPAYSWYNNDITNKTA